MSVFVLKVGSTQQELVRQLQNRLVEKNLLSAGDVDGAFGQITKKAVIAFQQQHSLTPDGIVGRQTAQALNVEVPNPRVDIKVSAPKPDHILTPAQRELLAIRLDALIPTGPFDLIDGSAIRWVVDKFEAIVIKNLPSEWVSYLSDINQGLTSLDPQYKKKLVDHLNKDINIWFISEATEEKVFSYLVDILISAISLGGNLDTAFKDTTKRYLAELN